MSKQLCWISNTVYTATAREFMNSYVVTKKTVTLLEWTDFLYYIYSNSKTISEVLNRHGPTHQESNRGLMVRNHLRTENTHGMEP